jgi:hypothetical protein
MAFLQLLPHIPEPHFTTAPSPAAAAFLDFSLIATLLKCHYYRCALHTPLAPGVMPHPNLEKAVKPVSLL